MFTFTDGTRIDAIYFADHITHIGYKAFQNYAFGYTGEIQTWIAPYTGRFEVIVNGAQGQNGANGQQVYGYIWLNEGDVLYLNVGGQDGYNGGGAGAAGAIYYGQCRTFEHWCGVYNVIVNESTVSYQARAYVGGGASDIRVDGTELENRIIVAGGGGSSATANSNGVLGIGSNGSAYTSPSTRWIETTGSYGCSQGGCVYHGIPTGGYWSSPGSYAYSGGGGGYYGGKQGYSGTSYYFNELLCPQVTEGANTGNGTVRFVFQCECEFETEVTEPTCLKDGSKVDRCHKCGFEGVTVIPALGHDDSGEGIYSDNNGIKDGERYKECLRCGDKLEPEYLVKLDYTGCIESVSGGGYYKEGDEVTIDAIVKDGETWEQWRGDITTEEKNYKFTMPGHALRLEAKTTKAMYTVNHWKQNTDDFDTSTKKYGYTLADTEILYTNYNSVVTPGAKRYERFSGPRVQSYNVGTDDSTVINYYYDKIITLKFDGNNPEGSVNEPILEFDTMEFIVGRGIENNILPTCFLDNHAFSGWALLIDGEYKTINSLNDLNKDTTLYATWDASDIKIVLILNDENAVLDDSETFTRKTGDAYNLPTPSCLAKNFVGWYTDPVGGTLVKSTDLVSPVGFTEVITLYAHWNNNTVTVKFDANGGNCSITTKNVTTNVPIGDLPIPTRAGFRFDGWYTARDGGDAVNAQYKPNWTGTTTLYAHWLDSNGEYGYTGKVQSYTAAQDGFYRIEAWGAQGGNYSNKYSGGKGGYQQGTIYLKENETIYIYVGGHGTSFNGGGSGSVSYGGGATDIRTTGTVGSAAWNNNLGDRILVAGGGGGATTGGNGSAGGTTEPGTTVLGVGQVSTINGDTAGGGGGYYGGEGGVYHKHLGNSSVRGGCYTVGIECGGYFTSQTYQLHVCGPNASGGTCCGECGCYFEPPGYYPSGCAHCYCPRITVNVCSVCGAKNGSGRHGIIAWGLGCGLNESNYAAKGGSNYLSNRLYLGVSKSGEKSGNGKVKITPLHTVEFVLNKPTTANADVNATNTPYFDSTSGFYRTVEGTSRYVLIMEKGTKYNVTDTLKVNTGTADIVDFPYPYLKGWNFTGWYTEPNYKTINGVKTHSGVKRKVTDTFNSSNSNMLYTEVLYAHWEEDTYYIKYYKNDTTKNIYGDENTTSPSYNTNLKQNIVSTRDTANDWYIQKVQYDHDIEISNSLYFKQGYYFNYWTNNSDTTTKGENERGTGTGKCLGTKYYESKIITPVANGESFIADKGNFNYITNPKQVYYGTASPIYKYLINGTETNSDTVVFYAIWEPIAYQLGFNGNENWNTEQGRYLQTVTDSNGASTTKIRYDQYFTLASNKFTRNAPYIIQSPDGLDVSLNKSYSHVGWGFGLDSRKYDTTNTWKLLETNTKPNPDQNLLTRDYKENQANVRNVLSANTINAWNQYIKDWQNNQTATAISDKSTINSCIQNLWSIWRVQEGDISNPGDTGDPTNPTDSNFGITLTFDLNGGYINKNNRFYYSPIVLKQELFNDYYYEFDIIGNVNKDHLNHTAIADIYGAYSNTNTPKKNYNAYTGLNVIYNKGDGNGGLYRLSGWSTNKGAIYPDYKVTIDGIKNNNFDTFDAANNNNTIKICNDTTLYAVWEPVLQMNVELTNTVTGNKVKTGTLTDATQENMQRNGLPTLAVKLGQEIKYLIALRGENKATVGSRIEPMNLTVEFDSMMTGIYNSQYKDLHDGLNQIAADDLDDPNEKMVLSTTNLNRKFVKQPNKSIIRKFSIPVYLGTERAEEVGYPSFKFDGYTLNITLSRPSNFHKGDEVVTAKLILSTTGSINSSGGSGGSGGNSGGGGNGSNLPSSTVGEFRTNIR